MFYYSAVSVYLYMCHIAYFHVIVMITAAYFTPVTPRQQMQLNRREFGM